MEGLRPPHRLILGLLGVLVVYMIVRGLADAATKPLWYDEIATVALSSQASMKIVWAALARPFDGAPPGFYVVERAVFGLFQNKAIATRLPAILAASFTVLCVFTYAKRRSGELIAFLCALLLLSTNFFTRYAAEARPYSLLVACIAFALVCYQRVPSRFWTALLGISLALAVTIHYYAVFAMVPFGLAEAVAFLRTRRFRWLVWLALVCGPIPLLFFWPFLASYRNTYGAHFYTPNTFSSASAMFGAFLLTDTAYGIALAGACIAGVFAARFWPRRGRPSADTSDADLPEGVLLLSLVGLPGIAFVVTRVMHGGMRDAYLLPAILGICLAVACVLSLSRPIGVAFFAVFLFLNVGVREFRFWRSAHSLRLVKPSEGFEAFLRTSGYANSDLPIVVASGMVYTPLAYYSSPQLASRLFYLTDEEREAFYEGGAMFDKNVTFFKDYMPLQVRDYKTFTATHPVFLLYGEEPQSYGNTWLAQEISHQGYSVQQVAVDATNLLFLVDTNSKTQKQAAY